MFEWLKKKIGKLFGKKKKKTKRISKKDIEEADEALKKMDRAKSNAEADSAMWKRKFQKLKNSVQKREKVNVGKKLQEEQERLSNAKFEDAVSLKKLMETLDKKKVSTVSAHGEKEYGYWKDIALLKNGQMAWIVENNGKKTPLITGQKLWDMLRDHKNPAKSISKGIVHINLDGDGNYVENLDAERVPKIIKDANGNFVQTKLHSDEVMKVIADKERKIRQLQAYISGLEESFLDEHEEKVSINQMRNLQKKRSDVTESQFTDELEKTKRIMEDNRIKDRTIAEVINSLKTERDIETQLYNKRKELFDKISKWFPEEEEERVKGKTKNLLSWLQSNIIEPSVAKKLDVKEEKESESE